MENENLLQKLQACTTTSEAANLRLGLEQYINYLLQHDFSTLVQLLYRVDVPEQKLKTVLQQQPQTDAAVLITQLLIERQLQKAAVKKNFTAHNTASDEERW